MSPLRPRVDKQAGESQAAELPVCRSTMGVLREKNPPPDMETFPSFGESKHHVAMSNADGCPECVMNTEPPRSAVKVGNGWRCAYLCSSCGHAWTTDWRD